MTAPIRIAAPAKLNLFLHITGKRADGYHFLESLTAFTRFGDTLEFVPADTLSLELTGPFAATLDAEDNLVLRAARLLQAHSGHQTGARITLHKHIPLGAGLGGGSTDAAATLRGLEQLWNIKPTPAALQTIALQLGSDVPACLQRSPAFIAGTGEQVTPVAISASAHAVLVNPRIPLLTANVYRTFAQEFSAPTAPPQALPTFAALLDYITPRHNALEAPAIALVPEIRAILEALAATPGCRFTRMSGSGATCFALYETASTAENAARQLQHAHPGWWVQATKLEG